MSNSIWKTPDQKPEKNKQILEHWKNCYGEDKYAVWIADGERGFDRHTVRWCYCEYVDDLIAQADKAERLQKAVDNYEKVIVGAMFAPDVGDVTAGMLEESHKTIKQLIK